MKKSHRSGKRKPTASPSKGLEQVTSDFAVGSVPNVSTEKNFKKRMARFANSKVVITLAVLMTLSAILSIFRPYLLPINCFLTAERTAMAACLWVVYATGGKRGMGVFAWLSVVETVLASLLMAFFACFVGCGMFSMQFLVTGQEDYVRLIKNAGMWAVIPGLAALAVAYCVFLFKRHERLVCCNLRDALRYGFAFDRGSIVFTRNCIIVAIAMPVLYILRGVFGDLEGVSLLSNGAKAFYNAVLPVGKGYWLNLVSVLVHSVALGISGAITVKYSAMVKKYKQQKEAKRKEEDSLREGIEELKAIEEEKEAERKAEQAV